MAYGTTLTFPTITGSHNDAAVLLLVNGTRNDLPSDAYNSANAFTNGGGNFVAYTDSTKATRLPVHVIKFVTGASPDIAVRIGMPPTNPMETGATVYVEADDTQISQPAAGSTYGREAVYPNHTLSTFLNSVTPENSANTAIAMTPNAVSLVSGPWGDALDFNGSSSDIDAGDRLLPTGDFTYEVWINPDVVTGFQGLVGNWTSGESGRSYFGLNGSGLNWDGYSDAVPSNSSGTVVTGSWQKATCTRSGTAVDVYINSTKFSIPIADNGVPNTNHNTFIGGLQEGTSNWFNGQIAYVGLSNTYSDQNRVTSLYVNESQTTTYLSNDGWVDAGGGPATITGTSNHQAQPATHSATGEREVTGTASHQAQAATHSASGTVTPATNTVTGTASHQAQPATHSATGEREITGTAAHQAQPATHTASGTAGPTTNTVTGTAAHQAQPATHTAIGEREITGTAAHRAQPATHSATGVREITGTAAHQAQPATHSAYELAFADVDTELLTLVSLTARSALSRLSTDIKLSVETSERSLSSETIYGVLN